MFDPRRAAADPALSHTETDQCWPPAGTAHGTEHILSAEVGDGSTREEFIATWDRGLWHTKGVLGLSPRKAAWATWQYVRPTPAAPAGNGESDG